MIINDEWFKFVIGMYYELQSFIRVCIQWSQFMNENKKSKCMNMPPYKDNSEEIKTSKRKTYKTIENKKSENKIICCNVQFFVYHAILWSIDSWYASVLTLLRGTQVEALYIDHTSWTFIVCSSY